MRRRRMHTGNEGLMWAQRGNSGSPDKAWGLGSRRVLAGGTGGAARKAHAWQHRMDIMTKDFFEVRRVARLALNLATADARGRNCTVRGPK